MFPICIHPPGCCYTRLKMRIFIFILFFILSLATQAQTEINPSAEEMRPALVDEVPAQTEKNKERGLSNYLRADYIFYLLLIGSGAFLLIRKRKSKNIDL